MTLLSTLGADAWIRTGGVNIAPGQAVFFIINNAGTKSALTFDLGVTWREYSVSLLGFLSVQSIAFGDGIFVLTAGSELFYISRNGAFWSEFRTGVAQSFQEVAFGNNFFVSVAQQVGNLGVWVRSNSPFTSWTTGSMPGSVGRDWRGIAFGNNTFVACATATDTAYSTDNGATWTRIALPAAITSGLEVLFGNNTFVVLGDSQADYATSTTNGASWIARTLPASFIFEGVFGAGLFIVFTTAQQTTYYTSPDAITWTARTFPVAITLASIFFANGNFIALGSNLTNVYFSTDGINWTARTPPSTDTWVVAGGGTTS